MLRAIIIEDEIYVREGLKKMLQLLNSPVEIIGESGHVSEGVALISKEKPDLVFMDIELEDGTSFDILQQLEEVDFKIIFTTAYNQYAIKAFKFSAIDYLLKPIDPLELQEAIQRALSVVNEEKEYKQLLSVLKNNLEAEVKKIVLKTTENRYVVSIKDIVRLEADGAYTIFHTKESKIVVSKNIKFYQELLDDSFIRCHQSHVVNLNEIVKINKKGFLALSNGETIPVSTRKKSEITKIISEL